MTNKQISRTLKLVSNLIELTGGNSFRSRAYASAARAIDSLDESISSLLAVNGLTEVRGIGGGLADDIRTLHDTGTFDTLEQLIAAVPAGLLDVLRVKGLGPKRARTLWTELGVTSLDSLEEMALTGRVANLAGFGKKTEEKLLDEIRQLRMYMAKRHYFQAADAVAPLLAALREHPEVDRAEVAGALRRKAEIVSEVDLVVSGSPDAIVGVLDRFTSPAGPEGVLDDDAGFWRLLPDGLALRVFTAERRYFPSIWWRRTGGDAHVAAFEERFAGGYEIPSEEALYEQAGIDFIPPELREGSDELDLAAQRKIPRLITTGDLRGTIHNHTTASDGAHSLREMAAAARAMGYEYLGICDHSQSLVIANGLTVDRLRRQGDEIRALNEEMKHDGGPAFHIFHGTECDIMPDGSLDFPDDVLAELDLVVASIHTRFGMTEDEATERLIRATEHPLVDVIGHPTGRLLLRREGYPVDHEAVLAACAASGVAIELNANPYRLDLDWRYVRRAIELAVPVSINPDAHSTDELRYVEFGVAVARKGWLAAENCLNALPLDGFTRWLTLRRTLSGVTG